MALDSMQKVWRIESELEQEKETFDRWSNILSQEGQAELQRRITNL